MVTYKAPTASSPEGPVAVSCLPESGSTFPIGMTTVTCTAEDKAGKSSANFTVTVTDNTPPMISGVPGEIEREATSSEGAVVTYTNPTASDIVDGTVPVNCAPPSGSTFPVGTTAVKCTAKDKAGNEATASFNVKVTPKTSTAPPTIEGVPANIEVPATGPSGAMVTYKAPTASSPEGPVAVSCLPESGSTFPIGMTTVTCTAEDKAGKSSANFTVTVTEEVTPAGQIHQLLDEVLAAPIPAGVKHRLAHLLREALRALSAVGALGPPGQGSTASAAALHARSHASFSWQNGHRQDDHANQRACYALMKFGEEVARDQNRRKPKIPGDLASTWSQAAERIEASLGCDSDKHFDDSDQ
jgi:hypothetical protein